MLSALTLDLDLVRTVGLAGELITGAYPQGGIAVRHIAEIGGQAVLSMRSR